MIVGSGRAFTDDWACLALYDIESQHLAAWKAKPNRSKSLNDWDVERAIALRSKFGLMRKTALFESLGKYVLFSCLAL